MANYLWKNVFPYDLKLSHSTSVTNEQTDRRTDRRMTTMPIARPLFKYDRRERLFVVPSDVSSVRSDSVSICCSLGSSVYLLMLCNSSGTLVQCCIGEMSRSGSCRRWQRSSLPHHCIHPPHRDVTVKPHLKVKSGAIAHNGSLYQSYAASPAVWDRTVLPATRHWWTHPALTPAR